MISQYIKNKIAICSLILLLATGVNAQPYVSEGHVKVAMRMIGHEMLLLAGDTTSRLLPIEKIDDRYKIRFKSEFEFDAEELVEVINNVISETGIAPRYLVEMEDCNTGEVVYSYEIDLMNKSDIIPCRGREQIESCYNLFFTILEPIVSVRQLELDSLAYSSNQGNSHNSSTGFSSIWMALIGFILVIVVFFLWRKGSKKKSGPEIINIGEYQFDKLNMQLMFKNKTTELSSKESDLLFLLYTSVNTTLERENILKVVWGDDGDYVGRTMDVFISKLRKKLADDSNLKIINIRGVGYKFVVNE